MGAKTTGRQMMEADQGPQVCIPGGRPRSQMRETLATPHPSAPASLFGYPTLTHCWSCSKVGSHLPASPGDAFVWIRRGTFTNPRLHGWTSAPIVHHSLALTVQVALICLALSSLSSSLPASPLRDQVQGWALIQLHELESES